MYRLPDALRPVLATPFGPIHDTAGAVAAARAAGIVVTVGDVVTQTLLDHGIVPKLMIVDGVTQRGTKVEAALRALPADVRRLSAHNPPARITAELIAKIREALAAEGRFLLAVAGEEDLAALPVMMHAPDGALVLYGQPNRGAVVVTLNAAVRRRATDILNQMEQTK